MKRSLSCGTAFTAALLVTLACVSAQERREQEKTKPAQPNNAQKNQQPAQPGQPVSGQRAGQQHGDSQLAACLISDNEGEIEIAKFAAEKSQNAEVKAFAQQMVKDHGAFLTKLQRFAPGSTGRPEADDAANPQRRDEQRRPGTAENRTSADRAPEDRSVEKRTIDAPPADSKTASPKGGIAANPPFHGAPMAGQVDLLRIKQEIGRECVATFKKELSAKKSDDFDKCYVGQQVGAHLQMGDTLKVMKKYASPKLRAVLEEGEKTAAQHLDHAKSLAKDLEGKSEVKRTADATKEKD